MSTELVTIDFRKAFPVFPLQDSVLLPQAVLPLHVFEERYRSMVNDALDTTGFIAIGLFDGIVEPEAYQSGDFGVRPFVGIGQIRDYHRLADGRFIIILQGLCRACIVKELKHTPYRVFQLAPAEQDVTEETQLEDYRRRIEGLMEEQFMRTGSMSWPDVQLHDVGVSTRLVVDLAIDAMCHDTRQRYRMLSQPDVRRRAEWVISQMESQLPGTPGHDQRN